MQADMTGQIEALKTTGMAQLLEQYKVLFGNKAAPGNRIFLIRKLAYRMQEQVMGGFPIKTFGNDGVGVGVTL